VQTELTQPTDAATSPAHRAARVGAAVGGQALRALFGAAAVLRGAKPIHTRGVLRRGTLLIDPAPADPTGVPVLDTAASHRCLVRPSRSVGLPRPLPDIEGLAVRVTTEQGPGDILFASTGAGPVARHCLVPRRSLAAGPLTTLLPVRSPTGPLLLGLFPRPAPRGVVTDEFDLRCSRPRGGWRAVGILRIGDLAADEDDPPVRFDPVRFQVAGLEHYPVWAAMREPAYAAARSGYPAETVQGLE
jgi:hypothetical protein